MTGKTPQLIGANGRDAIRDPDTGDEVYVSQLTACVDYDPATVFASDYVVHHTNLDEWCDWRNNLAAVAESTHQKIHTILS